MLLKIVCLTAFLSYSSYSGPGSDKTYHKEFYASGVLKSQGWKDGNIKTGYWFFYRMDGSLEKEGHFLNGKMNHWWIYYDEEGFVHHKCQLVAGKKNGFCLTFRDGKLTAAEKYIRGEKIREWRNFSSFKRENNLSDLR
ncbi:MAG TPA: hypothetical protein VKN36_12690 [Eudoraea sp.]|nr:hypothetical protein [Eudoraea sp.]